MTATQENILVLGILLINTLIAIGYLIFGFIKTRKKKKARIKPKEEHLEEIAGKDEEKDEAEKEKAEIQKEDQAAQDKKVPRTEDTEQADDKKEETSDKEEQFAHDETQKFDSFCKYVILSVVIFLCPVAGIAFLGFGTIFYRIFFDSSIDLAAITFSKERVDVLERPDMEEEMNLVPLEEAIMIEDKESLRQLLLTVLRGDVSKSIGAVTKALNSSDSEASHYAASAIMDITNEFQINIQKFQAQLETDPTDQEINQLFIEYLVRMLNAGFLSELELKTYVYMLNHNCERLYTSNKNILKVEYYSSLVHLLTKIKDLQLAKEWVKHLQEDYPDDIEMYRCVLHFYFETREKEDFFYYMNKLKQSEISIDKDLLELIRVFQ